MFTVFAARSIALSLAAATALSTVAAPAQAAPVQADGASLTVHYGDLDLTTQAGAATLRRRVSHAATEVCGGSDRADVRIMAERSACRSVAIASAAPQMQVLLAQGSPAVRTADAGKALTIAAR